MDASAYLQRHGWRGDGHSLDHSDRGIKKPLLVSKKVDVLGVGLNKHQAVSDQWWLRAFDQGLKTFGTGQKSALGEVQKHGVNRGGLYARFTQGEGVPGSIGQSPVTRSEVNSGSSTPVARSAEGAGAMAVNSSAHLQLNGADNQAKGKTRKRAEQSEDKSARRKAERREKTKRPGGENEAILSGEEAVRQRKAKKIRRRKVRHYVLEAQQRGIIPTASRSSKIDAMRQCSEPSDADFLAVMDFAGLDPRAPCLAAGDQPEEAQKRARKKTKRKIKRAAEMYLSGEATKGGKGQTNASENVGTHGAEEVQRQSEAERLANKTERKKRTPAEQRIEVEETCAARGAKIAKERERLKPAKLAKYEARAKSKGLSLDEYLGRRSEKHAARKRKKRRKTGDD